MSKKKEKDIDLILKESMKELQDEMEIYGYDDEDEEDYVERRRKQASRKKKKKKKNRIKIAVLVTEIMVILGLVFTIVMLVVPNSKAWLASTWIGKFFISTMFSEEAYQQIVDKDFDRNDTGINEDLESDVLDEYTNIALFGVDARYGELNYGVQSDCIIIVSIHKESGEVQMASVYRDTHVRCVDGDGDFYYGKINSAYNKGGAVAAVKTLNTNFDLNIKDYVTVNFDGISGMIDLLGGIDINITEHEAQYINGYINSYFDEIGEYDKIGTHNIQEVAGVHHLDGVQATAYCRIRLAKFYLEDGSFINNDFGRAARQRLVINKMVEKAKTLGMDAVMEMAEVVFEGEEKVFLTSIPYEDVIDLIPVVLEFTLEESAGYPQKFVDYSVSDIIPDTLAQTVVDMHKQLFGDEKYVPSSTVLGINRALCSMGGIENDFE